MTDDTQALLDEVQRLKDIEAIKQLRARYFQLVDAQDWEAWGREILTEDFYFDSDGGVQEGRDTVIAFVSKSLEHGKTVHHGHMPLIEITGPDTATGTWTMNDYVTMQFQGNDIVMRGWGHYHDEYVRTPDGWRLRKCTLTRQRVDTEGVPDMSVVAESNA
jgi:hypothetical protein